MPNTNQRYPRSGAVLLSFLVAFGPAKGRGEEIPDKVRFSDQPAPLQLEGFPERPPLLLELGDKFLGKGNIQRGFTMPGGAVWSPNFWVYGTSRSAVQTFDPGSRKPASTRTTEWANRLDIFANLQLAATERILVGFRPVDQNATPQRFSGYQFEPVGGAANNRRGFIEAFSATPRTFFFEGEFGEMFPKLDKADKYSLDYGIAVGRQPLTLQDGLLVNDDSIDMVSITRNSLNIPGGSTMKISPYFAWDQIERGDNRRDKSAGLFGINATADFPVSTVDADVLYVTSAKQGTASTGGDGFYAGLGSSQRLGKLNTVFRVNTSVATEGETRGVKNGTLLFAETSYTPWYGQDLVYLNGFWGINEFTSAARSPTAGGPLGRVGILNAAVGLGRYGAPLSNFADNAAGGAIGYQMFFGQLRRKQLTLEIGGRAPTRTTTLLRQEAAEGIGARYQQAFGQRVVVVLDVFGVTRETAFASYGGRLEFLVKF